MTALLVVSLVGCTKNPREEVVAEGGGEGGTAVASTGTAGGSSTGEGASGTSGSGDDGLDSSSGSTGVDACECAPGTDLVYVVSDDGELWSYDPASNGFEAVGPLGCGGFAPFSMAVDRTGRAWLLLLDDIPFATVAKGLFTVPLDDPSDCQAVAYTEGLFGVFGMSFVDRPPPAACEDLYVHSYSGDGPFAEGRGLGMMGQLDEDDALQVVGSTNFDGAELAGTSEGRLFSVAGTDPIKIVEYDRDTIEELSQLALPGIEKTSASAMAYWGGDFYVFVEAGAPACPGCLEKRCSDELAACEADPDCAQVYDCLVASGGQGVPGCEGDIVGPGGPLRDCMLMECEDECSPDDVVSRVIHVDHDDSDGGGQAATVVEPFAPVRIVGAGSSTCVPVFVP